MKKTKLLHIVVEGRDLPEYWIHIEAPANATLEDLDGFLRDIWLECCGHLSAFTIEERTYAVQPEKSLGEIKDKIRLLARNDPPSIICGSCGKTARHVCAGCGEWLCDECATGHECGEDMLLPVVNSPRVGMCGYTG